MDAMLTKAQTYVGMPYIEGEFDCADLAAKIQWEVFGRVTALPVHRKRPRGAMGQAREIRSLQDTLAVRLDEPTTGCCALLYHKTLGSERWHIGTVFIAHGEIWLLHNSSVMGGACLQRIADLKRFGLSIEGYYRPVDTGGPELSQHA